MRFSPPELEALRRVTQTLQDVDLVLIGAAALREFGFCRWRSTFDLDLTVALDLSDFPGLLANVPELRRDPRIEHRFYMNQVRLDIVPAGPGLRAQGHVQWRDRRMSLSGLHLGFDHAVSRTLAPGVVIRVAPPHVVTVLKMISYCDQPSERERDLGDIAELIDSYLSDDDDRRFDDDVLEAGLPWDGVSAYTLGADVARVLTAAERPCVEQFLTRARGGDALGTFARLLRTASFAREEREAHLMQQLDAFERGLGAGVGGL